MAKRRPHKRPKRKTVTSVTVDRDAGTATAVQYYGHTEEVMLGGCRCVVSRVDVAVVPLPPLSEGPPDYPVVVLPPGPTEPPERKAVPAAGLFTAGEWTEES